MNLSPVSFAELPGWAQDDFAATLPALEQNCKAVRGRAPWTQICAQAARLDKRDAQGIRSFFERHFQPHRLAAADNNDNGLVTGYYEPLLRGSRQRRGPYQHPVLKLPADLVQVDLGTTYPELKSLRLRGKLVGNKVVPYGSRAELDASGYMSNPANVLLWVDDPVEAFFLGIQGSGRVKLDDGSTARVGYADQNGHPYKSIGRWLIDQGELRADQATMQGIKAWVAANPARAKQTLNVNPSVVFFREMPVSGADEGPVGSLNVPLTAGRSIAVDPRFIQLGTPVYLASSIPAGSGGQAGSQPLQRLVFAQDTGSAIKGAVRADWFTGFGEAAGELAGRMKQAGKMYLLLPRNN